MITDDKNVKDADKKVKSEFVRSGLISLIDNKKTAFHGGLAEIVKKEFGLICQARENGATRAEVVEVLGFPGKEEAFSVAFWREKRRRAKKEKEVVPEKKKMPPAPKEEKNKATRSDSPVSTDGVVTGTKPPDPKEPEPRRNRWREIKY